MPISRLVGDLHINSHADVGCPSQLDQSVFVCYKLQSTIHGMSHKLDSAFALLQVLADLAFARLVTRVGASKLQLIQFGLDSSTTCPATLCRMASGTLAYMTSEHVDHDRMLHIKLIRFQSKTKS